MTMCFQKHSDGVATAGGGGVPRLMTHRFPRSYLAPIHNVMYLSLSVDSEVHVFGS